jgi:hypothetical protein
MVALLFRCVNRAGGRGALTSKSILALVAVLFFVVVVLVVFHTRPPLRVWCRHYSRRRPTNEPPAHAASNAAALNALDHGVVDVLSHHLPERARVVYLADAPKLVFARVGCPTLHVPYLSQVGR